jgi:hypothetical protein
MEIQAFFADYFLPVIDSVYQGFLSSTALLGSFFLLPMIFLFIFIKRSGSQLQRFDLTFCAGIFMGFLVEQVLTNVLSIFPQGNTLLLSSAVILLMMHIFYASVISGIFSSTRLQSMLHKMILPQQAIVVFLLISCTSFLVFIRKQMFFEQFSMLSFLSVINLLGLLLAITLFSVFCKVVFNYKKYDKWLYDLLVFFSWTSLFQSIVILQVLIAPWMYHAIVALISAGIGFSYWMNIRMEVALSYAKHYASPSGKDIFLETKHGIHFFDFRIFFKRLITAVFIYFAIGFAINSLLLFKKVSAKQALFRWLRSL